MNGSVLHRYQETYDEIDNSGSLNWMQQVLSRFIRRRRTTTRMRF